MASMLEQLAGKKQAVVPYKIRCQLCRDEGFTGCPEAIVETGTMMALAWRKGVACSCPAGSEFAQRQMEWMA